jgi:hypothetical protein
MFTWLLLVPLAPLQGCLLLLLLRLLLLVVPLAPQLGQCQLLHLLLLLLLLAEPGMLLSMYRQSCLLVPILAPPDWGPRALELLCWLQLLRLLPML